MSENFKKFLEAVSQSEELVAKANASKDQASLIALAKELGVTLNAEDFPEENELSDDELDAVAGGSDVNCACAMGGGGSADSNDKTCACVLAGVGYDDEKSERCLCGFAGWGYDT